MADIREGGGFGVRVLPSGIRTFFYIYRIDGQRRFLNLGHYDPKKAGKDDENITLEAARSKGVSLAGARKLYHEAKAKVDKKIDPLAEKQSAEIERKRTPTVADFIEKEYIEKHAKKHNRGWKEIERALKAEIIPRWGKRKITDIKRRDLVVLLDEIEQRAPIMANRTLAYTRKLFSYAVKRDVLEVNPFLGMEAPAPAKVRERNLTFAEIKTLWTNLDTARMSDNVRRALKLILVTGQRPGEVIGMHSREIDGRWWTIPEERSKNKQAHRVYLTDLALEFISKPLSYVFPSPVQAKKEDGTFEEKPLEVRTLTHAIKENLPHTPESKVTDYLKILHFVPHDLRRTATSRMAEIGILEDTIDRVQNHVTIVKKGVRKNYNHYAYDNEKQAALETWERKLQNVLTGKKADNVVNIAARKGKARAAG